MHTHSQAAVRDWPTAHAETISRVPVDNRLVSRSSVALAHRQPTYCWASRVYLLLLRLERHLELSELW